jgi:hypothetical protein
VKPGGKKMTNAALNPEMPVPRIGRFNQSQTANDLWIEVAKKEGIHIPEPKGKLIFA